MYERSAAYLHSMEKNAFTRWGFRACMDCGDTIHPGREHECEEWRTIEWQVCLALPGIETIDRQIADYLATPQGAFEVFYAEYRRLDRV